MPIIVKTRNKKEEKLVREFLESRDIHFTTEAEEDHALYKAMVEGRKTALLSEAEQAQLLRKLSRKR
jgi:hypothetical protein